MAKAQDSNSKKRRRRSPAPIRGYGVIPATSGFGWAPSGWTSQSPPTDETPNSLPGEGMQGGPPLNPGQFDGGDAGGDGGA